MKQSLNQRLSHRLSPQQIQLMKLVQLPMLAFEQEIYNQLEENPALNIVDGKEEGLGEVNTTENVGDYLSKDNTPYYRLQSNNNSKDREDAAIPYASEKSLGEYLLEQIRNYNLDEEQYSIAKFIIGSIDDSGYLRRSLNAISDDLAFSYNIDVDEKKIEEILKIIQKLEPVGVASRNLQECLSLQLRDKKNTFEVILARKIINSFFEEFTKKHFNKILEQLEVDNDSLKLAFDEIHKLNPKPGNSFSTSKNIEHITPDFILKIDDGVIDVMLNNSFTPKLNISQSYKNLLETYNNKESENKKIKETIAFVKQKIDNAKWFIDAINQRKKTLYDTMKAIVNIQRDYFLTGDEANLKPMKLKDIAEKINLDISTISRVVNSKYVSTPYGIFLLKNFFSDSAKNEKGEDISTREIKKALADIIEKEDKKHPLIDTAIMDELKSKGYIVARRTVAKYREQLGLPVARLRKSIL